MYSYYIDCDFKLYVYTIDSICQPRHSGTSPEQFLQKYCITLSTFISKFSCSFLEL